MATVYPHRSCECNISNILYLCWILAKQWRHTTLASLVFHRQALWRKWKCESLNMIKDETTFMAKVYWGGSMGQRGYCNQLCQLNQHLFVWGVGGGQETCSIFRCCLNLIVEAQPWNWQCADQIWFKRETRESSRAASIWIYSNWQRFPWM